MQSRGSTTPRAATQLCLLGRRSLPGWDWPCLACSAFHLVRACSPHPTGLGGPAFCTLTPEVTDIAPLLTCCGLGLPHLALRLAFHPSTPTRLCPSEVPLLSLHGPWPCRLCPGPAPAHLGASAFPLSPSPSPRAWETCLPPSKEGPLAWLPPIKTSLPFGIRVCRRPAQTPPVNGNSEKH